MDTPVAGGGAAVTVTLALPVFAPEEAETVKDPPATLPAVNIPEEETVPPPLTDQVNAGDATVLPNGSAAVAVNCCVPFVVTLAEAGFTLTLVRV